MEPGDKTTIEGKEYIAMHAVKEDSCEGCAFDYLSDECLEVHCVSSEGDELVLVETI